jgi:hypothetical protein
MSKRAGWIWIVAVCVGCAALVVAANLLQSDAPFPSQLRGENGPEISTPELVPADPGAVRIDAGSVPERDAAASENTSNAGGDVHVIVEFAEPRSPANRLLLTVNKMHGIGSTERYRCEVRDRDIRLQNLDAGTYRFALHADGGVLIDAKTAWVGGAESTVRLAANLVENGTLVAVADRNDAIDWECWPRPLLARELVDRRWRFRLGGTGTTWLVGITAAGVGVCCELSPQRVTASLDAPVRCTLAALGGLELVVIGASGEMAETAELSMAPEYTTPWRSAAVGNGSVSWPGLPEGNYYVRLRRAGELLCPEVRSGPASTFAPKNAVEVHIPAGQRIQVVVACGKADTCRVEVVVHGAPAPGSKVFWIPAKQRSERLSLNIDGGGWREAAVDGDGGCVIRKRPDEAGWWVNAHGVAGASGFRWVGPVATERVELVPASDVSLRTCGQEVRVRPAAGPELRLPVVADGTAVLGRTPKGVYLVQQFDAAGRMLSETQEQAREPVEVWSLPRPRGVVKLRLPVAFDEPVAVRIAAGGKAGFGVIPAGVQDGEVEFELGARANLTIHLSLKKCEYYFLASAGGDDVLELPVAPFGTLAVQSGTAAEAIVLTPQALPSRDDAVRLSRIVVPAGFEVGPVLAGAYAARRGEEFGHRSVSISPQETARLDFGLPQVVSVRVLTAGGAPLQGAHVIAVSPGAMYGRGIVSADGSCALRVPRDTRLSIRLLPDNLPPDMAMAVRTGAPWSRTEVTWDSVGNGTAELIAAGR